VEDIQTGRALAVYKRSNSRWLCLLAVEGREAVVVYSRSRRSILTFLPKDCPEWQLLEEARKP
jgi:hypothetical protein